MSLTTITSRQHTTNPLDIVEELVSANDWAFERAAFDDGGGNHWPMVGVPPFFLWRRTPRRCFSCLFDHRVPERKVIEVSQLLALINEKLWLGHFDIDEDGTPVFRHNLLLRGVAHPSVEQMEDMIDYAMTECEDFSPLSICRLGRQGAARRLGGGDDRCRRRGLDHGHLTAFDWRWQNGRRRDRLAGRWRGAGRRHRGRAGRPPAPSG